MRNNARVLSAVAVVCALTGCVLPGAQVSPYGKPTTLYLRDGGGVSGELLAATADSIWLMREARISSYGSEKVRKLNVERHKFDGKRSMLVSVLSGVATGTALAIACNRYEATSQDNSTECTAVIPATALVFAIPGALFALSNNYSSMYHLVPSDTGRLRAYSRFPQGLPDTVRMARLVQPAGITRRP
jgi:predicted neutral ceramidase superfamily lipid hydrolase